MINLFRNFKLFYVLCVLIKLHVAEETNNPIGSELIENNDPVFDFSETFSEEKITDLLKFLYDNTYFDTSFLHNKTVRLDCENQFFTTVRLERLGASRIKLECTKEVIVKNAVNGMYPLFPFPDKVCIQQKASMRLASAYKPIIAGVVPTINLFPNMVAIGYPPLESQLQGNTSYSFECGGTLISDRYVLTAAHCFKLKKPVILRLGVNRLEQTNSFYDKDVEALDVNILNIHIHPLYKKKYKYHDIALIEAENPVPFSLAIYPSCVDTSKNIKNGTEFFILGWGLNDEGIQHNNLNYAKIVELSRSVCTEKYGKYGLKNAGIPNGILESQICAGDFTSTITDTCSGDSGGPLQSKPAYGFVGTVQGVTSFGLRCGSDPPSVFTKVSYYRDWIESIVWPQTNDTRPI